MRPRRTRIRPFETAARRGPTRHCRADLPRFVGQQPACTQVAGSRSRTIERFPCPLRAIGEGVREGGHKEIAQIATIDSIFLVASEFYLGEAHYPDLCLVPGGGRVVFRAARIARRKEPPPGRLRPGEVVVWQRLRNSDLKIQPLQEDTSTNQEAPIAEIVETAVLKPTVQPPKSQQSDSHRDASPHSHDTELCR